MNNFYKKTIFFFRNVFNWLALTMLFGIGICFLEFMITNNINIILKYRYMIILPHIFTILSAINLFLPWILFEPNVFPLAEDQIKAVVIIFFLIQNFFYHSIKINVIVAFMFGYLILPWIIADNYFIRKLIFKALAFLALIVLLSIYIFNL
jgi:hypothetical protein